MPFEVPRAEGYCEKCGTTNYIYDDMDPPHKCDTCGAELSDPDEAQYEHEEGKYDGEV